MGPSRTSCRRAGMHEIQWKNSNIPKIPSDANHKRRWSHETRQKSRESFLTSGEFLVFGVNVFCSRVFFSTNKPKHKNVSCFCKNHDATQNLLPHLVPPNPPKPTMSLIKKKDDADKAGAWWRKLHHCQANSHLGAIDEIHPIDVMDWQAVCEAHIQKLLDVKWMVG